MIETYNGVKSTGLYVGTWSYGVTTFTGYHMFYYLRQIPRNKLERFQTYSHEKKCLLIASFPKREYEKDLSTTDEHEQDCVKRLERKVLNPDQDGH